MQVDQTMDDWIFREPNAKDSEELSKIYNHYVENTIYTVECNLITAKEMLSRMTDVVNKGYYILVEHKESAEIIGFAYARPWDRRKGFRYCFESSIYLKHDRDLQNTKGLGTLLYQQLLQTIKADGNVKVLLASVISENDSSKALHEKIGFQHIATFPQIAVKFNQWLDVDYWAYYFY